MGWIDEFKKFALRGNVIDLAVGFTVGAAFTTIAKSLVDDILMPPMGAILGSVDFKDFFVVIKEGREALPSAATLANAKAAGAVTLNYGLFLNNIITFLLIAFAMFLIIRGINRLESQFDKKKVEEAPTTKDCPFCRSSVHLEATRCPHCTSELTGSSQPTVQS